MKMQAQCKKQRANTTLQALLAIKQEFELLLA